MYAIARSELEMTSGKLASQVGHAFVGTYSQLTRKQKDEYDNGIKIVLNGNLANISDAIKHCEINSIPHYLMIDEHHIMLPHFDGSPVITALGIGPIAKEQAYFLKHLKLVK